MSTNAMPAEENRNQRKPGRLLVIGLFAAVFVAFSVSGGFVLARQQLLARQTTQLTETVARGPHVLVTQISGKAPRERSSFRPRFMATSKLRSTRRFPAT